MTEDGLTNLLASGHRACPGCGPAIAVRLIMRALGSNTIVACATGCLETFTSPYGQSSWEVPWIHSLFENTAAVASGVEAALEMLGEDTKVVAFGGDGGTFDIGFGALSGMFERRANILYVCYDNEAYMNTGVQRSSATPLAASTTTTPPGAASCGKVEMKKDVPAIARAHGVAYVATGSIAYPQDLMAKVKKAAALKGPKYLQVHTPCCIGWGFDPSRTVEIGRLAVETGLVPIYELDNDEPIKVKKVSRTRPVIDYLSEQTRFRHLRGDEAGHLVDTLQKLCDSNIQHFGIQR